MVNLQIGSNRQFLSVLHEKIMQQVYYLQKLRVIVVIYRILDEANGRMMSRVRK